MAEWYEGLDKRAIVDVSKPLLWTGSFNWTPTFQEKSRTGNLIFRLVYTGEFDPQYSGKSYLIMTDQYGWDREVSESRVVNKRSENYVVIARFTTGSDWFMCFQRPVSKIEAETYIDKHTDEAKVFQVVKVE